MMRKIVLFALLGLLAISCSDDDPATWEQDIVGVWELIDDIPNMTPPAGTPKYIKFDGNYYYSSSDPNPSSNQQKYTVSTTSTARQYAVKIGDKDYEAIILTVENEDLLELSYIDVPADPENDVAEQRVALPYKRVAQ